MVECLGVWPASELCSGNGVCVSGVGCVCDRDWVGLSDLLDHSGMDCAVHLPTVNALYTCVAAASMLVVVCSVVNLTRRIRRDLQNRSHSHAHSPHSPHSHAASNKCCTPQFIAAHVLNWPNRLFVEIALTQIWAIGIGALHSFGAGRDQTIEPVAIGHDVGVTVCWLLWYLGMIITTHDGAYQFTRTYITTSKLTAEFRTRAEGATVRLKPSMIISMSLLIPMSWIVLACLFVPASDTASTNALAIIVLVCYMCSISSTTVMSYWAITHMMRTLEHHARAIKPITRNQHNPLSPVHHATTHSSSGAGHGVGAGAGAGAGAVAGGGADGHNATTNGGLFVRVMSVMPAPAINAALNSAAAAPAVVAATSSYGATAMGQVMGVQSPASPLASPLASLHAAGNGNGNGNGADTQLSTLPHLPVIDTTPLTLVPMTPTGTATVNATAAASAAVPSAGGGGTASTRVIVPAPAPAVQAPSHPHPPATAVAPTAAAAPLSVAVTTPTAAAAAASSHSAGGGGGGGGAESELVSSVMRQLVFFRNQLRMNILPLPALLLAFAAWPYLRHRISYLLPCTILPVCIIQIGAGFVFVPAEPAHRTVVPHTPAAAALGAVGRRRSAPTVAAGPPPPTNGSGGVGSMPVAATSGTATPKFDN